MRKKLELYCRQSSESPKLLILYSPMNRPGNTTLDEKVPGTGNYE